MGQNMGQEWRGDLLCAIYLNLNGVILFKGYVLESQALKGIFLCSIEDVLSLLTPNSQIDAIYITSSLRQVMQAYHKHTQKNYKMKCNNNFYP